MDINWDLVDRFQQKFGAQIAFEGTRELMFAYVSQIQAPLPPVAEEAMEVARRFREGTATAEERTRSTTALWDHIGERRAWTDPSPECSIIRVMTWLLRGQVGPGESDSITELLRECLPMVDKFENHSDSAALLIEQYFSG